MIIVFILVAIFQFKINYKDNYETILFPIAILFTLITVETNKKTIKI